MFIYILLLTGGQSIQPHQTGLWKVILRMILLLHQWNSDPKTAKLYLMLKKKVFKQSLLGLGKSTSECVM